MQYRNDGSREEYQIQNQFTAYLQVALKRRKNAYLSQRHRQQQHERPMEPDQQPISAEAWEDEYFRKMELLMEYRAVLEALDQLQKRERYILLARIMEERSFTELARELQVGYPDAVGWRPWNAGIRGASAETFHAVLSLQRGRKPSADSGQAGWCSAAAARKRTANRNGCRCSRVSG